MATELSKEIEEESKKEWAKLLSLIKASCQLRVSRCLRKDPDQVDRKQ